MTKERGDVRELVRPNEARKASGYGPTQFAKIVREGKFPAPVRLSDGGRALAFFKDEIAEWQRNRPRVAAKSDA